MLWNLHNSSFAPPKDAQGLDLQIFVITHKDIALPQVFSNKDIYHPLRVGNALHPSAHCDWLKDDYGANISSYNEFINEITGIAWVAKHYEEIGNPNFVGFNHYRRFLQWSPHLLGENTVISTSGFYPTKCLATVSIRQPLALFRRMFMTTFSETDYCGDYDKYFAGHTIHFSNLFISDKNTFFRYYHFIEKCLGFVIQMIESNAVDMTGFTPYQKRVYSFYLEHMTSFWIWH